MYNMFKKHKKCSQKKWPFIKASTREIEKSFKKYAQWLQDWEILKRIQNVDFVAKEIHYHNICWVRYQNKSKFTTQEHEEMQLHSNETEKHDKSVWHISCNAYQNALQTLIQEMQDDIVEKKSTLPSRYQQILWVIATGPVANYNATKMEDKIINHFQEKTKILKAKTIRDNIIYSSHFSPEEALCLAGKKNIKLKIREADLNLRNAIKDAHVAVS